MPLKPLRQRLRDSEPLLATFSILRSAESVEIVALAGFDAIILDLEHGPYGVETLGPLILAAHARGIHAIARVLKNDAAMIGAVLDAGADGVLVPQVSTPTEAQAVVAAARFAPEGARGANSWVRAAGFNGTPEWFARANAEVAVIVMIEGRTGADNAEAIMATPSLDGVFLGPVDLSHALGVPGQIDHPLVLDKMTGVIDEAKRHSLATAVFAPTPQGARRWMELGVRLVACGVDTGHLFQALRSAAAAVR
ncbi:HpcH/HpaI aldolase family protein [Mangrovicella endophytica]|uniref:HpcH/HpaI aldolase family protein n=1 Tax=Mangrovicella endophytica TaxID=2066697 RepID=UPI000C9E07E8|nr:aldolase/citrate lyase family protein [Mangrovicella endophytica]